MKSAELLERRNLEHRLAEAEATIEALLSGQIDAVVDSKSSTPVLLSRAQEALRDRRHCDARYGAQAHLRQRAAG